RNDAGTAKSKIRFYEPEEVTRVFEQVVQNPNVAAVLFRDSMFYNITPILKEKDIKTRVRILTKDSFIGKFYKVLRDLDAETIERIYLPKMDGEGVEAAIRGLLS
ncbi:MAG: hypothetical protein Q4A41_06565, partial [Bacillota bacterium]|nr:hypothetical protein [Bacillota bacterium]